MENQSGELKRLKLTHADTTVYATLFDNPAAMDFAAQLPLTLQLTDYAGTEKISYLPSRLSTKNAPPGAKPYAGHIAYYAPWGNLAVFYKDFSYSEGLILLGKIEGDVQMFESGGPVQVEFALAD